jgi:Ca2+-binding RTX toxin-like protein
MEDARTHHLMNTVNRDFDHDFTFQDITYDTDVFDFAVQNSANHPEFNTSIQNSHQYLSHPDVLGPSAGSWVAALKPGELTIFGNNADNNISVTPGAGNDWNVSIGTKYTFSNPITRATFTFWLYSNMTVDANTPDLESINPYDDALTKIKIYGRNGNDTLTVSNSITASTYAYGGAGNDAINGGGGHDYLYGEAGKDVIHGNNGNDRLFGGAAVDQLFGDAGDDHLYGAGQGADDSAIDKLTGGSGRDRFYRKIALWPITVVPDDILDFVAADDQIVLFF